MDSKTKALKLLEEMIQINEELDKKNKKTFESGESWHTYHLKLLKELIEDLKCQE